MFPRLHPFLCAESGAVTVDWVVLTAAITGLGLASAAAVRSGTVALGDDVETSLSSASVAPLDRLGDDGYFSPDDYHFLPQNTAWWNDQWQSFTSYSDASLLSSITWTAGMAEGATQSGDSGHAAHRVNYLRIAMAEAQTRGLEWPAGTTDFSTIWTAYHTKFPQ